MQVVQQFKSLRLSSNTRPSSSPPFNVYIGDESKLKLHVASGARSWKSFRSTPFERRRMGW